MLPDRAAPNRVPRILIVPVLLAGFALTACGGAETPAPSDTGAATDRQTNTRPTPGDEQTATGDAPADDADLGPVETYLAWLEASRIPDVDEACGYLSDELIDRMLAEMAANGYAGIEDCAQMTQMTADLYRTFNQGAEVDVRVVEENQDDATLFVTYVDSGECGTIVLSRKTGRWIITEQSEGCDG